MNYLSLRATDAHERIWDTTIIPEHGGHCVALTCTRGNARFPLLEDVPLERISQKPTSYGCPLLFPYANRVHDQSFHWNGQRYRTPTARHGFVRDRPWQVNERSDAHCVLTLRLQPPHAEAALPYDCNLRLAYTLHDGLTITLIIENRGDTFPYTLGFHPYLSCQLGSHAYLPAQTRWKLAEDTMIPTGELTEVPDPDGIRHSNLGLQETFDELYGNIQGNPSGYACARVVNSGNSHERLTTTLTYLAKVFPFAALYKPMGRTAVCLEPYTSATNALQHADDPAWGLRVLAPSETAVYTLHIGLE